MPTRAKFTKVDEIEYAQVCETYRQGVRTLFDTLKFYIIFQGALGTLAGAVFARDEFQWRPDILGQKINLPLLAISVIGFLVGSGALLITKRLFKYHDALVERAEEIESKFGMNQIKRLNDVWKSGKSYRSATMVTHFVFFLVAFLWLLGVFKSVF
ncbi:MAG: hypothetical protein KF835_00430 [Xanthobacteraceae bacterium]|nr:hypothetical protein [Xanthobacteraceae bacterium]